MGAQVPWMAPSAAQQSFTELDDDPHAHQVVNLVELLVLQHHLFVDRVEVLGPAGHLGLDPGRRPSAPATCSMTWAR